MPWLWHAATVTDKSIDPWETRGDAHRRPIVLVACAEFRKPDSGRTRRMRSRSVMPRA